MLLHETFDTNACSLLLLLSTNDSVNNAGIYLLRLN